MSAKKAKKGISSATAQQISNSLAYLIVQSSKSKEQTDMITTLSELGFNKKTIVNVLHADPLEVAAKVSELKAARKSAKKNAKAEANGEEQPEAVEQDQE